MARAVSIMEITNAEQTRHQIQHGDIVRDRTTGTTVRVLVPIQNVMPSDTLRFIVEPWDGSLTEFDQVN